MSKILEIIPASQLKDKLPQFLNIDLDLIFKTGVVMHGVILKITDEQILFKDKILNKHKFTFNQIEEVVLDKEKIIHLD